MENLSYLEEEVLNKFLLNGKKEYVSDLTEGNSTTGQWNWAANQLIKKGLAEITENVNGYRTIKAIK